MAAIGRQFSRKLLADKGYGPERRAKLMCRRRGKGAKRRQRLLARQGQLRLGQGIGHTPGFFRHPPSVER